MQHNDIDRVMEALAACNGERKLGRMQRELGMGLTELLECLTFLESCGIARVRYQSKGHVVVRMERFWEAEEYGIGEYLRLREEGNEVAMAKMEVMGRWWRFLGRFFRLFDKLR